MVRTDHVAEIPAGTHRFPTSVLRVVSWTTPADVKAQFADASILRGSRVVVNIACNKYRLVTRINYAYRIAYVRFIGAHEEYDQIDATTI